MCKHVLIVENKVRNGENVEDTGQGIRARANPEIGGR